MTNLIVVQNPLMQPIHYNGQVYITSHSFYKQYSENGLLKGKYERHGDFMRLIRSIPAYYLYVERKDIVELEYSKLRNIFDDCFDKTKDKTFLAVSDELNEIRNADFALLFKSNSYKPIMLINATMQLAISHHLDDEISKAISVSVNTQAAAISKVDTKYVQQAMKDMLALAKMCGLEGNQAILGANRATKKLTGHSPIELIEAELVSSVKEKTMKECRDADDPLAGLRSLRSSRREGILISV